MTDPILAGPTPPNADVKAEWDEASRRRRMLEGAWRDDLNDVLRDEYTIGRLKALGVTRTTKNLAKSTVSQLSVIYDRPAIVGNPGNPEDSQTMRDILKQAGTWQLAQRFAKSVIGIREAIYRFSVHDPPRGPFLQVQIVTRDRFHLVAHPDTPDEPHTFYHYRLRQRGTPEAQPEWTRDCLSIEDPKNPIYRIENDTGDKDLSAEFGLAPGWPDQWRKSDTTPVLPISLYHAERTTKLTDTHTGIELFDGSLMISAKLMQLAHLLRDQSHPQRAIANMLYKGPKTLDGHGHANIEADFGSILMFQSEVGRTPVFHQWDAGGDPAEFLATIQGMAADIVADFDVQPSDIARTHTDARSGYAISISREGQRAATRRYEPQFERGDIRTCEVVAAIWNQTTGSTLPEEGWEVQYPGLPLSMDEKKLLLEDFKMRDELGATSLPTLVALLEGRTEDDARNRLEQFEQDNARFRRRQP